TIKNLKTSFGDALRTAATDIVGSVTIGRNETGTSFATLRRELLTGIEHAVESSTKAATDAAEGRRQNVSALQGRVDEVGTKVHRLHWLAIGVLVLQAIALVVVWALAAR